MRKTTVTILTLCVLAVSFYFYKNKNRYFYEHVDVSDYTERVRLEKELDSIKASKAIANNSVAPDDHAKCLSTAEGLRKQNDSLRAENEELKSRLKTATAARATAPSTQTTQKTQSKNEKTLPIARNSRAVELQRFLTELYGDR